MSEVGRYRRPGGAFVSLNVGYAPNTARQVRVGGVLAPADRGHPMAADGATLADVDAAAAQDSVAVAFDLEDSGPLEGHLDRIQEFYELGVRTMLVTYNNRNAAGGGCLDEVDEGLTGYGRRLVAEMDAVGVVVDGSHCGRRTGLELSDVSQRAMIYSHSCMHAVWDHPRNITDEQARECAATGGVVGITGVGIFLGPNDASLEALLRHIDYAVDLLGPEHVGLATDFPFDTDDFNAELLQNAHLFPDSYTRWGPIQFMPPEGLLTVGQALADHGYSEEAVKGVLGGNFRRVAAQVWADRKA